MAKRNQAQEECAFCRTSEEVGHLKDSLISIAMWFNPEAGGVTVTAESPREDIAKMMDAVVSDLGSVGMFDAAVKKG